jgi:hypothetical protein
MTCDFFQKQLLSLEALDRPSTEVAAHLACCNDCREWHARLLQIEQAALCLPVPSAAAARTALLAQILGKEELASGTGERAVAFQLRRRSLALIVGSWILDSYAGTRRRVGAGLVAGAAAAVLLFFTGLLAWYNNTTPTPEQRLPAGLIAELDELGIPFADGTTPQGRVQAIVFTADQLHKRCCESAYPYPEKMAELARLYNQVVRDGIVPRARALPVEQRRQVLDPLVDKLADAGNTASEMAGRSNMPPESMKALDQIASAANYARTELGLLRDGQSS